MHETKSLFSHVIFPAESVIKNDTTYPAIINSLYFGKKRNPKNAAKNRITTHIAMVTYQIGIVLRFWMLPTICGNPNAPITKLAAAIPTPAQILTCRSFL